METGLGWGTSPPRRERIALRKRARFRYPHALRAQPMLTSSHGMEAAAVSYPGFTDDLVSLGAVTA